MNFCTSPIKTENSVRYKNSLRDSEKIQKCSYLHEIRWLKYSSLVDAWQAWGHAYFFEKTCSLISPVFGYTRSIRSWMTMCEFNIITSCISIHNRRWKKKKKKQCFLFASKTVQHVSRLLFYHSKRDSRYIPTDREFVQKLLVPSFFYYQATLPFADSKKLVEFVKVSWAFI